MTFGMVAAMCSPNFLFGTIAAVGIDPTNFEFHPTTIPPGGVVENCPPDSPESMESPDSQVSQKSPDSP